MKYRQASLEAENVEKIQETPAECSKASPEAENVEKTQRTHWRDFNKLARKQEMLERLKKTHWRNLDKLARKQRNGCENLPWDWFLQNLQKLARKQVMLKGLATCLPFDTLTSGKLYSFGIRLPMECSHSHWLS